MDSHLGHKNLMLTKTGKITMVYFTFRLGHLKDIISDFYFQNWIMTDFNLKLGRDIENEKIPKSVPTLIQNYHLVEEKVLMKVIIIHLAVPYKGIKTLSSL